MQLFAAPPADLVEESLRQVTFSPAARAMLAAVARRDGPQAVVLSWPSGAAYLRRDSFDPGEHDVVLGYVVGCPVFADTRRLSLFVNHRILLDADPVSPSRPHPPLWVRSTPNWEPGRALNPSQGGNTDAGVAQLTGELMHELGPRFADLFAEVMISAYIRVAVAELRGSVSAEALPEMAARLVQHRLAEAIAPSAVRRTAGQ